MSDMISKKELLKETGISYGQLYRWKREKLIPDAWFEKQSSFTGQETFFPRTLILERIHFILTHKDEYSLTELRNLLSPDADSRSYSLMDVATLPNAQRSAQLYAGMTGCNRIHHGQALTVVICAMYDMTASPDDSSILSLMTALESWREKSDIYTNADGRLYVIRLGDLRLPAFTTGGGEIMLPEGADVEYSMTMNDISRTPTRMLNKIYEVKKYG